MIEDIGAAPAHVTVAEAAQRLRVTRDAVRRLIRRGELPATRIGRQWLVLRSAVDQRATLAPRSGRRMSPATAWGLLVMADGGVAPWLTPQQRWRVGLRLQKGSFGQMRDRLVARGRLAGYRAHPSLIGRVRQDPTLVLTGVSAASTYRLGLVGGEDRVDAYVHARDLATVVGRYHLRPSSDPNVRLRVVARADGSWPYTRVAPRAAVALDLLDDDEPRLQEVGARLLGAIGP